ncbi:hypothetical protein [Mariniphaga sp.]|uniref:hypothetical protein n=1 Tax=Mariniphaga sp. TaxID=1954475 RepID=UPI0035693C45
MKTKKLIWKSLAAFVLGSVVLTSCLEDPEPVALDAVPDVFMQKIVQDGAEKYGLAFWVLGNKALDSVMVEGPDEETWALEEDPSGNRIFSLFPEEEDYTDSMPELGDYTFTVKSTQADEVAITIKDELEDEELDAVVIDSTKFNNLKLEIYWQEVENTDGYYIRLYDDSDDLIYMSARLDDDDTDYSFGVADTGWANTSNKAQDGENYRIEVMAILYESGSTSTDRDYNVQFISKASTEIVWGE